MQSQDPSQFTAWLPPHLVTLLFRWETRPLSGWYLWGLRPAQGSIWPHLCALLQSTPELWCVGSEDRSVGGVPTEAGQCCCAGSSGRCHRPGAEPSAGWTWPRSF